MSAPQSRWVGARTDVAALRDAPFISAPKNMVRREIEDAQLHTYGLEERRVLLEFGHPEAMKHAVRQDLGLCFLPACCVSDDVARGALRVVELPGVVLRIPAYLVHRDTKHFSAFQQALVDHLRSAAGMRHKH
ncbi:putative DNA-binding transcriptional regulator [compost metagenome]